MKYLFIINLVIQAIIFNILNMKMIFLFLNKYIELVNLVNRYSLIILTRI